MFKTAEKLERERYLECGEKRKKRDLMENAFNLLRLPTYF